MTRLFRSWLSRFRREHHLAAEYASAAAILLVVWWLIYVFIAAIPELPR